jgi:HNH endonuclease
MGPRKSIPRTLLIQLVKTHGILCQSCRNREFEEIHHIDGDRSNNAFDNLMLQCLPCHKEKHEQEPAAKQDIGKMIRIGLDIEPYLYKEIRIAAMCRETTFTKLIMHWIREGRVVCKHDKVK